MSRIKDVAIGHCLAPTMSRALPPQIIEESKIINYGVDMEELVQGIQKHSKV